MTKNDIINFFIYLDDLTKESVNSIEITPIMICKELYLVGLRRSELNSFEIHLKKLSKSHINTNTDYYMMIPQNDMWINMDVINLNTLSSAFITFKANVFKNPSLTQLNLEYKEKNSDNYATHHEIRLYDDKKLACKQVIEARKIYNAVKSKFTQLGDGIINKTQEQIELEFAEAAL